MKIKCWGTRGSIPVSGKEYIKYGGDTTCLEIRTKSDDIIIVDAGTGIRRLGNQLLKEGRLEYNLIFTHAHWDHLMGFPFFKPVYRNDTEITAYRCPFPGKYVENMISKTLSPPNFPVKYSDVSAKISYKEGCPSEFEIGSVSVTSIRLSHPNGGSGYRFEEDGKSFVFLTDNELGFLHPGGLEVEDYLEFCEGADLLFHDAEYTPEEYSSTVEWGHSTYPSAIKLGVDAGAKKLGLFHMSQDRTDDQVDQIVEKCHEIIEQESYDIECVAIERDKTFTL
jgi:phosphoribosyl 1,2-cyclic phosphodiesterase